MSDIVGQEGDIAHDSEAVPDNTRPQASVSGQSRGREELGFHSPTESEDDTDGREAVGVAPPLGQQEKYHVFFCYSKADAPWVKNMVQKLESDELGFSCCFHERDFTPGIPIIENIVRSIQASRKTVFVLSREFVTSRWCTYEMQMVMRRHLSEGEKLVIPVMLRECDLPEFIQHMTYLEESTPYFFDKFIGALKESFSADPSAHSDSFSTFTYNSNFTNGELVLRIESVCDLCPPCARFDDRIFPPELATRGIRVPRSDYLTVLSKLKGTGPIKYFNCCFNDCCFWALTILAIVILWLITLFTFLHFDWDDDNANAPFESYIPVGLFLLIAVPSYYIPRYRMKKAMKRTVLEVNTILAKSHIIASVADRWCGNISVLLHFVYYETGPCLMQILEDLMTRASPEMPTVTDSQGDFSEQPAAEGVSSSVVSVDMDAETPLLSEGSGDEDSSPQTSRMSELKTEAEALLLKYSDVYVRLLVTRKLPQPRQSRGHTQQGACLCQLVELREFGWKLDREETSVRGSGDPSVV